VQYNSQQLLKSLLLDNMNEVEINPSQSLDYLSSFQKYYFDICQHGYSILQRTPKIDLGEGNHWQFESGYPPSYSAQGRHRFFNTLAIAESFRAESILEVACGGGFNGACLYQPGRRIVLNDIRLDPDYLKIWRNGEHLEAAPGNFFELDPNNLGQFDLVLACDVIEHIAHGDQCIDRLKKFLRPQGTLLLTTPNGLYFRSKLPTYAQIEDFTALEAEQFKPDADGHLFLYTPAEITTLLQNAGFTNINLSLSITPWLSEHVGLRFLPAKRWLMPFYYQLDQWTSHLIKRWRQKVCFQIIVTANLA
jgi:2-polyprenyl-3-methyl-5-hydroxy-6-metoxy-1,4-benzoquinol methylase